MDGDSNDGMVSTFATAMVGDPRMSDRSDKSVKPNLTCAIHKKLRHWANYPIFHGNDRDRKWLYRKLDRQSLQGKAVCIEFQQSVAEVPHETATFQS
jgi:hypothetical protein